MAPQYGFEKHIDRKYLIDTLVNLLRIDCSVPLGPDTLMEPDHPKLVHYVQNVIRGELYRIGIYDIIDAPRNQMIVRIGSGRRKSSLLIMAYTPVQHHNLMSEPFSGRIRIPVEYGINEPCAFGQGAEQNKAHFAAMLTLLKAFVGAEFELTGSLYFGVNNEGRSSHECSKAIVSQLNPKPESGLILIGGGNEISVANRGRVDIIIRVAGKATHSSRPEMGLSAIDGANEALNRIRKIEFTKIHPKLGGQHAIPYQLIFDPIAPHTLPETAIIKIDRRLLPGDDVDEAVDGLKEAVGDMAPWRVAVEKGVAMLPSIVDPESTIVRSLSKAICSLDGEEPPIVYGRGAFDAGGLTSMGIPTIMWGRPDFGDNLLGDDFVTLRGVEDEARIVGRLVTDMLS